MSELPHGWALDHARNFARRAARAVPSSVLRFGDREAIAYWTLIVDLYEATEEPDSHYLWNRCVHAISAAIDAEMAEHGYSTSTDKPMPMYAAYWQGIRRPGDWWVEDKIIEPMAVRQIMPVLPTYQQRALRAVAHFGDYHVAAEHLGVTPNTMERYLTLGRRSFMTYWNYPDPPPARKWGHERTGGHPHRAIYAIRRNRKNRKRREAT